MVNQISDNAIFLMHEKVGPNKYNTYGITGKNLKAILKADAPVLPEAHDEDEVTKLREEIAELRKLIEPEELVERTEELGHNQFSGDFTKIKDPVPEEIVPGT